MGKEEEPTFRSPFGQFKTDAGAIRLKSILAEVEKLQRIRRMILPPQLFDDVPLHVVKLYRERISGGTPREVRRYAPELRCTLLTAFCRLQQAQQAGAPVGHLAGVVFNHALAFALKDYKSGYALCVSMAATSSDYSPPLIH
jgi:hypothetical protein